MCVVQATEDKNAAVAQAEKTAARARLADRLINGLSGEFARWTETIKKMSEAEGNHAKHISVAYMNSCTFVTWRSYLISYQAKPCNSLIYELNEPRTRHQIESWLLCSDTLGK